MTSTIDLIAGLDIGNGWVKGVIRPAGAQGSTLDDTVDIPSGATVVTGRNRLPVPADETAQTLDDDFYNHLDVSFDSPLVGDAYRRLFGERSLSAKGSFEEFNVMGNLSKAEQSLSKELVLGLLAGKAVREHFRAHGSLPAPDAEPIQVRAVVALALPITEFMEHRKVYAAEFTGTSEHQVVHEVVVHNFEAAPRVRISFLSVPIIAEGASAQFAITEYGASLLDRMLADVRARGVALEGIGAADLLAARNTVGIDIGEGTVNFPVFTAGKFNQDASTSLDRGYGSVLEDALEAMKESGQNHGFASRKQLAAFLQGPVSPLNRTKHQRVAAVVAEHEEFFADQVAKHFAGVLSVVGAQTEVCYVYGGGAVAMKEKLYPRLLAKLAEMVGSEDAFAVLYLESAYARHLNREGLLIAACTKAAQLARQG